MRGIWRRVSVQGHGWIGGLAGLVFALAGPAAGQVPEEVASGRVELRWSAPGACPPAAALVARIDELLGEAARGLEADATVQAPRVGESRWRLDLRLRWPRGSDDRTLHASSCAALADATVVLIAVLAAPLTVAELVAAEPTVAPRIEAPPVVPAPLEVVPPARPVVVEVPVVVRAPLVRRRGPFARVVGVAGYGVQPRADLGLQLAVGGLRPRLRVEGGLTYLPGQTGVLPDGRGATHAFAAGGVRVCPRLLGPIIELSLCGGLEVGARWGRSVGLDPARRAAGPWLALSLAVVLDWWFSPQVGLHAGVEGLGAPVATAFAIGESRLAGGRHFGARGLLGLSFALTHQGAAR